MLAHYHCEKIAQIVVDLFDTTDQPRGLQWIKSKKSYSESKTRRRTAYYEEWSSCSTGVLAAYVLEDALPASTILHIGLWQ